MLGPARLRRFVPGENVSPQATNSRDAIFEASNHEVSGSSYGARSIPSVGQGKGSKYLATRNRRDIQGLRALAVLLVVLNHAGVGFLKGGYVGVDLFFVLSGYLITGLLTRATDQPSSSSLRSGTRHALNYFSSFYARRARRILPAATLTLVVTDLAASSLLNLERAHQVLADSIYSTFFVANYHFASVGTNYFAMGQPPSPLQHFWSLSVEEQFYLVWPVLVLVALVGVSLGGRSRDHEQENRPFRIRALGIVAGLITVASFVYALHDTHVSATAAYFSSSARAWELGLGALLSLNVGRLARLPSTVLTLIGWSGIIAILVAGTLYSASTLFPGLPALLPTIGAAAVITAGLAVEQSSWAPSRILSLRPFRYIGDRSYTFYLWHWPVLVLVAEHAGHRLSVTTNLVLLAGAFALSTLTYAVFENPIRRTVKLRGAVALALWPTAIVTVLLVSSIHWSDYQDAVNVTRVYAHLETLKQAPEASLSASTEPAHQFWRPSSPPAVVEAVAAVRESRQLPTPLTPSALELPSSEYTPPQGCLGANLGSRSSICRFGNTSSRKSLVVFGDSHANMWMPAIISFAQREGYDVRAIMKSGCMAISWAGSCGTWYRWGVSQVRALRPALLIVGTHYNSGEVDRQASVQAMSAFSAAVRSSVGRIVVIGDPPEQEQEPTDCLLSSHATMQRCSHKEELWQTNVTAGVESATEAFGVFLDTVPWLCYQGVCPMVVGHTVVNLNRGHITARYAEELAPLFTSALARLLAGGGGTGRSHNARASLVSRRSGGSSIQPHAR